jgi:outer membrane immunogenic protein
MKIATVIAVAGLIGTPAFAADMAVKSAPPAPAPAPVYNWTGWYIGVNAGASMGGAKTDYNVNPFTVTNNLGMAETFPGFGGTNFNSPDGFIGGGQIGYNWQYSPLIVVGLEADFQGALEKDSNVFHHSAVGTLLDTANTNVDITTKIDWFGTVRGRIGYVWGNGNVMSYLTGGLAYGKVEVNGPVSGAITNGTSSIPFSLSGLSNSHVNTGWVLGYGNEGVIDFWGARNWTWRVETYYMDLGHLDTAGTGVGFGTCTGCAAGVAPFTSTGGQVSTHTHFTDWILRGGINYKFF